MPTKAIYGLSYVKVGATGANGAMGATLVAIPAIADGTFNIDFAEPTTTEFIPEDYDSALIVISKPGAKKIVFETQNMDTSQLQTAFGGAIALTVFTPGVQFNLPEQSLEFKTRSNGGTAQTWKFPRTQGVASISGNLTKNDLMKLKFSYSVLTPVDGANAPLPEFTVTQA